MALVTVCIPAYRSAAFVGQTLASVQRQELTDFDVILALEPEGAAETVAACRPYLQDKRFSYYVNDDTLGYAGNVRHVLRRVSTPYVARFGHVPVARDRGERRTSPTSTAGSTRVTRSACTPIVGTTRLTPAS